VTAPQALLHTFLDGDTMMLRIIQQGQVWQWALSLQDITTITATIAEWQQHTMARMAQQWTSEAIVNQINAREAASLEALRREAEEDTP
jgi:hypothetical protein